MRQMEIIRNCEQESSRPHPPPPPAPPPPPPLASPPASPPYSPSPFSASLPSFRQNNPFPLSTRITVNVATLSKRLFFFPFPSEDIAMKPMNNRLDETG
ncbi:hypothetical protein M0804_009978 [Polistes exclamans]|nr:hypothetical protein M0804_009978 [Polistes exclamans]